MLIRKRFALLVLILTAALETNYCAAATVAANQDYDDDDDTEETVKIPAKFGVGSKAKAKKHGTAGKAALVALAIAGTVGGVAAGLLIGDRHASGVRDPEIARLGNNLHNTEEQMQVAQHDLQIANQQLHAAQQHHQAAQAALQAAQQQHLQSTQQLQAQLTAANADLQAAQVNFSQVQAELKEIKHRESQKSLTQEEYRKYVRKMREPICSEGAFVITEALANLIIEFGQDPWTFNDGLDWENQFLNVFAQGIVDFGVFLYAEEINEKQEQKYVHPYLTYFKIACSLYCTLWCVNFTENIGKEDIHEICSKYSSIDNPFVISFIVRYRNSSKYSDGVSKKVFQRVWDDSDYLPQYASKHEERGKLFDPNSVVDKLESFFNFQIRPLREELKHLSKPHAELTFNWNFTLGQKLQSYEQTKLKLKEALQRVTAKLSGQENADLERIKQILDDSITTIITA